MIFSLHAKDVISENKVWTPLFSLRWCCGVVKALESAITQSELGHGSACRCRAGPQLSPRGSQTPRWLETDMQIVKALAVASAP